MLKQHPGTATAMWHPGRARGALVSAELGAELVLLLTHGGKSPSHFHLPSKRSR